MLKEGARTAPTSAMADKPGTERAPTAAMDAKVRMDDTKPIVKGGKGKGGSRTSVFMNAHIYTRA